MTPPRPLAEYRSLVFDCDGVLLDSNRIKTKAFGEVAVRFGEAAADALIAYHVERGGVSRYKKFEYLLDGILGRDPDPQLVQELSDEYGQRVQEGLLACRSAEGLEALRAATAQATWMVVSGGAQHQLRDVFAQRDLDRLFDGGIFGSPDPKDTILAREIASGRLAAPALFLGDSRYDHEAASGAGLDFLFVSDWSEFAGWCDYCAAHDVAHVQHLGQLVR